MQLKFISSRFLLMAILFLLILQLSSCFSSGTHGSIKAYKYQVSKRVLEKAVEKVIMESPNIQIDSTKNYIIDKTNGKNDTIINNHYNDGKRYITVKIDIESESNEYIFLYSGSELEWDTAKDSYINIAYAYDKNKNGGSEGNGGIAWYKPILKKRLIAAFEKEFIIKIDNELGLYHIDI